MLSDALNHASIIDSMRLAKAITKCTTAVYRHGDMDDLVAKLEATRGARRKIIWTDGIFSMEGSIAKLPSILEIARRFGAIVVVDDSHATGVIGETGRGTPEHCGVLGEVDVITSTLGKALGGASGGFVAGPSAVCDILTQRSRPQLILERAPADGRSRARSPRCSSSSRPPGARPHTAGQHALLPRADQPRQGSSRSPAKRRSSRSSSAKPRPPSR